MSLKLIISLIIIINVFNIFVELHYIDQSFGQNYLNELKEDSEDNDISNGLNPEICGTSPESRIVGGEEADPGQYPWMAALKKENRTLPICGGSLINKQYVLTAAHCLQHQNQDYLSIFLGAHHFTNESEATAQKFEIEKWKIHKEYDEVIGDNDIAIIQLKTKANYSNRIRPICLPPINLKGIFNMNATAAGWGRVAYPGDQSAILKHVTVNIWPRYKCKKAYADFIRHLNQNTICAGNTNEGVCHGDSGGPLMFQNENNRRMIIGVVSWGNPCALPNYPGVYVKVSPYIEWIENTIKNMTNKS